MEELPVRSSSFRAVNNYSFTNINILPGQNVTETYVLKVLSSAASQVIIPAAVASYSYPLSTSTFKGQVSLGQQVLQVNQVGPSLSVHREGEHSVRDAAGDGR